MSKTNLKDYILNLQSVRLNVPLKTIEAIFDFQYEEAHKALKDKNTVEISGFCKFIFNEKKAIKKANKEMGKAQYFSELLKDTTISDKVRKSTEYKLSNTLRDLELLKPKIENGTELFANTRGMEEQINSTQGDEGNNREDLSAENSDMQRL